MAVVYGGCMPAALAEQAQARFGFIGLDRYKDWIIDVPEGSAAKGAYPGALVQCRV